MQPSCSVSIMTQILEQFDALFPPAKQQRLWSEIEPRAYKRKVQAPALIEAFLLALLLHEPSQESVALRFMDELGSPWGSTLSYALRRPSSLALARAMVESLEDASPPWRKGQTVALDSMALSVQASRKPGARPINSSACGGAVLWGMAIQAPPGRNGVRVLRLIQGPWHDSVLIGDMALMPHGPVYLMDSGFWSLDHISQWLAQGVNFIMRVPLASLKYEATHTCGPARRVKADLRIEFDGIALLGSARQHTQRPRARLVVAHCKDKNGEEEDLVVVSALEHWSGERLLDTYGLRWRIEGFHRTVKELMGLAHFYSFQESGIFFLLHVALLLVALALRVAVGAMPRGLVEALRELRWFLGVATTHWRPNTARPMRRNGRKQKKRRKQPTNQDAANP